MKKNNIFPLFALQANDDFLPAILPSWVIFYNIQFPWIQQPPGTCSPGWYGGPGPYFRQNVMVLTFVYFLLLMPLFTTCWVYYHALHIWKCFDIFSRGWGLQLGGQRYFMGDWASKDLIKNSLIHFNIWQSIGDGWIWGVRNLWDPLYASIQF